MPAKYLSSIRLGRLSVPQVYRLTRRCSYPSPVAADLNTLKDIITTQFGRTGRRAIGPHAPKPYARPAIASHWPSPLKPKTLSPYTVGIPEYEMSPFRRIEPPK